MPEGRGGEGRGEEGRGGEGRGGEEGERCNEVRWRMKAPPLMYLKHADLPVGQSYEPIVDQSILSGVSWLPVHDVPFCLLICQGDGGDLCGQVWDRQSNCNVCACVCMYLCVCVCQCVCVCVYALHWPGLFLDQCRGW